MNEFLKAVVKRPGSRGGHYWYDKQGNIQYGPRPGSKDAGAEQLSLFGYKPDEGSARVLVVSQPKKQGPPTMAEAKKQSWECSLEELRGFDGEWTVKQPYETYGTRDDVPSWKSTLYQRWHGVELKDLPEPEEKFDERDVDLIVSLHQKGLKKVRFDFVRLLDGTVLPREYHYASLLEAAKRLELSGEDFTCWIANRIEKADMAGNKYERVLSLREAVESAVKSGKKVSPELMETAKIAPEGETVGKYWRTTCRNGIYFSAEKGTPDDGLQKVIEDVGNLPKALSSRIERVLVHAYHESDEGVYYNNAEATAEGTVIHFWNAKRSLTMTSTMIHESGHLLDDYLYRKSTKDGTLVSFSSAGGTATTTRSWSNLSPEWKAAMEADAKDLAAREKAAQAEGTSVRRPLNEKIDYWATAASRSKQREPGRKPGVRDLAYFASDYARSKYSYSGRVEDFAEAVMKFVRDPDGFTKRFPNRAALLREMLKDG